VSLKSDENKGYFTCRPIYVLIISGGIILTRNVSDQSFREYQNMCFVLTFLKRIYAVYEITWKNMADGDRP
jgi:hypothetical protein